MINVINIYEAEMEKRTKENGEIEIKTQEIPQKTGKKKKIVLVIWLSVIALLGASAFLLLKDPTLFGGDETVRVTGSNGFYDYFYEADFSLELEEYECYPEYMELDRFVYYKNGNETVGIIDENRSSFTEDVLFFEEYFRTIISGDSEAYNLLFTESYFETHEKKEAFTPQMVYGILVEKVSEREESGVLTYGYDVSYKLYQNNGTFRDDIYSDASRTQYIEINDSEGEYKIDTLKFYVYGNSEAPDA